MSVKASVLLLVTYTPLLKAELGPSTAHQGAVSSEPRWLLISGYNTALATAFEGSVTQSNLLAV